MKHQIWYAEKQSPIESYSMASGGLVAWYLGSLIAVALLISF